MGMAQAGEVIRSGDNLALQGLKPLGVATQGTVAYRTSLIDSSLTDFWPMNEGSGTTFNNVVNPSNPMTASNITWATNSGFVNAPSPQFNGTTSGAVSAQNSTLDGPFSLCIAVIMTAQPGTNPSALLKSLAATTAKGFQFVLDSGYDAVAYVINDISIPSFMNANTLGGLVALNQTYYLCVTYDGSGKGAGLLFYINGGLKSAAVGTDSFTGSFLGNIPVYMAQDASGGSRLTGTLANARIYNRVLSASEISALSATMGK